MNTPLIGQTPIIDYFYYSKVLPHFTVFVGSKGSGKRTMAKSIAGWNDLVYSEVDTKVDTVREVIDSAYNSATKVLYCFADADTMRAEAKNAMLKVTEEPPENAYFIMTVQDESTLLDTIKSRAVVIHMFPYTKKELQTYLECQGSMHPANVMDKITYVCDTPGDVDTLLSYNIQEFFDYVQLVYDNIAEVEPANAFKSSSKLAIKDENGYDLKLFFKTFTYIAMEDLLHGKSRNGEVVLVTTKYSNKFQKVGVNKQQLYDGWVFDIREAMR